VSRGGLRGSVILLVQKPQDTAQKRAKSLTGQGIEVQNERMRVSAIFAEPRKTLIQNLDNQIIVLPGSSVIGGLTPQVSTCPKVCRDKG